MVGRELDYQALDAFLTYTYIPAPLTIYREVRSLQPGHLLIWESGNWITQPYWELDVTQPDRDTNEEEWVGRFDGAIEDAVKSHMVSDVPVGAFLSGGIDSSLVVALMTRHVDDPVRTFTMGFGGARNPLIDERPLAKQVATRYGCDFHEYAVQPDFRGIVGEIVEAFDEPFADDGLSYYVSQFTRRRKS